MLKTDNIIPTTGIPGYHWDDPFRDHIEMGKSSSRCKALTRMHKGRIYAQGVRSACAHDTGMKFDKRGDLQRAILAFGAAVRVKRSTVSLMNLAVALQRDGQIRQAIDALHEARMEGACS